MVLSLQKNYFIAFIIIHCYNNLLMKKNYYTIKSVHRTFIFLILLGLLSNALAMSLPPLQVSIDTNKINSYAEYTITFDRSQITSPDTDSPYMFELIPSDTNITVIFPPEIDTTSSTSPSCNADQLTCGACTFSGNLLTVQNCFLSTNNVTSVILKISNIKNPQSPLTTSQFSGGIGSQFASMGSNITFTCVQPCQTCSSLTNCLTCIAGYSLLGSNSGVCLASCPSGYISISNICTECMAPCATCSATPTTCNSCIISATSPVFLTNQNTCVPSSGCPNTYYGNVINYQCVPCVSPCQICTSQTMCLSCVNGFQLSGTSCVSTCPTGQIPINQICTSCDTTCYTCSYIETNCTSCNVLSGVHLYLFGSTCVTTCPTAYYENVATYQCVPCVSSCQICTSQTMCLSCVNGFQLSGTSCVSTCPTGQIPINQICTSCDTTCYTCSYIETNCTSCNVLSGVHLYLFGSTCVTTCPTAYYENVATYQCVPCVSPCQICTSQTMCLSCVNGFQLSGTSCVSTCPTGQIPINQICTSCDTTCYTCSYIETNCTSCNVLSGVHLYLFGSTCVTTCPTAYYENVATYQCVPCVSSCQICTSQTMCLSCVNGFQLSGTSCVSTCPTGQIPINQICTSCDTTCYTCSYIETNCTSCNVLSGVHLYLFGSTCVTTCPTAYYGNLTNQICTSCDTTCYTCSYIETNCTSCNVLNSINHYLFDSTCVTTCPIAYYGNVATYQCVPCVSPCQICTSQTMCLSCVSGFQLSGTSCISTCPTGQIPINQICTSCDTTCYTCSYIETNCTSCNVLSGVHLYLFGSTCVTTCPTAYYGNLTNQICTSCDTTCYTCSYIETNCTSCNVLNSINHYLFDSTCVTTCPIAYYGNVATYQCVPCVSPCQICTSQTMCLSCVSGFQLSGTSCVSTCPTGQIPINQICTSCDTTCYTCSYIETNCTSCNVLSGVHLYLFGSTCVTTCPTAYYGNLTNQICTSCDTTCYTCSYIETNCTSCNVLNSINHYLFDSTCVTTCPIAYYGNVATYQCVPCVSPCQICTSQTMCLSCVSGFQLSGTSCVSTCPTGQIPINQICTSCDTTCYTCSYIETNCTSCNVLSGVHLYLFGSTCVTTCPTAYYGNLTNQICTSCDTTCYTCSYIETNCTSCNVLNSINHYLFDSTCVTTCPTAYYENVINYQCVPCVSPCQICTSFTMCLSCISGFQLSGTSCVSTCPTGQIPINQICTSCDTTCYTCSYIETNCTSCNVLSGVHLYLFGSTCVTTCPTAYYENVATYQCVPCVSSCQICTSQTMCLSCVNGFQLSGTSCISTCPTGQIPINQICTSCDTTCYTCSYIETNCTSCDPLTNLYLSGSTCVTSCPSYTYADATSMICKPCVSPCQTCSSLTNCLTCIAGYSLLGSNSGVCLASCPSGYISISNICTECMAPCATCSATPTTCNSCIISATSPVFLTNQNTCVPSSGCPNTYYGNVINYQCVPCVSPCQICTSQTMCLSCVSGFQLSGTSCVSTCPTGQIPINQICTSCDTTCYTCSYIETNCTSCNVLSGVHLYLFGSTCVTTCPTAYYGNLTNQICTSCDTTCYTCSYIETNCTSCNVLNSINHYLFDSTCVTTCPTAYYENVINYQCVPCVSPCQICTSQTMCLSCVNGFQLSGTSCISTCPTGQIPINQICTSCDTTCYTCSYIETNCTSCNVLSGVHLYLFGSTCVTTCPTAYYENVINYQCVPCVSPCQICTSQTMCLSCVNGFQLSGTSCISTCPTGQIPINQICTSCDTTCYTCSYIETNCTSCNVLSGVHLYLFGSTCVTTCPTAYYGNVATYQCVPCVSPCQICTSQTMCLSCVNGFQLSGTSCVSTCPTGQIPINQICTSCDTTCYTCSYIETNCTSCDPSTNLYLSGSTCVTSCPSYTYADATSMICKPCVSPCQTCSSLTNCLTCIAGYSLLGSNSGVCLASCPSGYISISNICTECMAPCATCSATPTTCNSCIISATSPVFLTNQNTCVPSSGCPNTYYGNLINYQCVPCVSPCQICTSQTMCLSCVSGFQLSGTSCVSTCPTGQIPINQICTSCDTTCYTCSYIETNCTSCNVLSGVHLYLFGSTCVTTCPTAYYENVINYQCVPCVSPCQICTSQTMCLSCVNGFQLSGTSCISTCPTGQIPINQICTSCDTTCYTCSYIETNCTSCNVLSGVHLYLFGSTCVTTCPTAYYENVINYQCVPCVSPCQICTSQTMCLSCVSGFQLSGTSCVSTCPTGQIPINQICTSCDTTCYTCSYIETNCTSCDPSTNLYLSGSTCVTSCPSYTYADATSMICKPCVSPCQTCSSLTNCLTCIAGYSLLGSNSGVCLASCPSGYISISNICTECMAPCATCSATPTTCNSCIISATSPVFLTNQNTCVPSSGCPNTYYGNVINYQCVPCVSPCQICTSQTMCLSCVSGFQLSGTSCVSTCPTGQIPINQICTSCDTTCYTCSYIETNCTSCNVLSGVHLYLFGSTCVTTCPTAYYGNLTNQICTSCDTTCYTCSYIETNCTSCNVLNSINHYLFDSTCVTTCPTAYYENVINYQCVPCVSPCQICTSFTMCLSCISGFQLSGTSCVSTCPTGQIPINQICTSCDTTCYTCSYIETNCTSCNVLSGVHLYLFGSTCVTTCPTAYYENVINYQCVPCVSPCQICTSQTMCLSCVNGFQLSGTSCISTCPTGQIPINQICTSCDTTCYTCSYIETNCTSCDPSTNLYLSGSTCVTSCPSYTYADATSMICKPCVSPCQTCSSLTNCLTCISSFSMTASNSGTCVQACPNGYLSVFSVCQLCNSPCATCTTTVNTCTSCLSSITPSVFLTNSQCVTASNCPSGFYGNTTTNQCTACVATCLTCTSFSACLSCPDPYSLYSSNCILTCPIGYLSVSFICQSCTSPCATCSGTLTSCLSCLTTITPAVFLTGTSCVIASNCPSGTYANTTINQCASCISPCSTCTNFSSCLSCIGGQPPVFLTGNSCVTQTQCPLGYYANFTNNLCTQCISSCSQCNDSNICLLCNTGYSLQSATNTCVTSCLYNQISINSICTTCSSPCLTCAYSTMNCTSCQSNLSPAVFLYLYSCVSICPDYTYPNITTNQCQPCVSPCATCTTSSLCLSCLTGYALYSNTCLSTCPQGTTSVNQVCMNCSSSCLTCINTTTICLSCALGYYLVPSSYACVSSCPANLFVNSLTQTCVGCDDACSTCSNYPTNCTACNTGILYNLSPNFTCVANCPVQYYNLSNICTACPTGCITCTSSASCQSCISGYYLYIESCLLSCPATTQIIVNDICKNCSTANCQNCTPNDYCYKCYSPYYILNGTCYSTCPPSFVAQSQTCYFQSETNYSVYPMPFSIATVIIIILCLLIRYNDINFFASGAIYSITSIPETLVNLYFVYLYYIYTNQNFKDRLFLCIVCSFAWLFLINILLFIVFYVHYLNDKAFKKWLKQRSKITYSLVIILSLFVNHKVINLIFSRMLRFEIFSARLENIKKFFWIHFMWFLSSIHTISGIGLCSYNLYINGSIRDQLYFESIDLMVVLILNSIFGILNLYKDQDYFKHKKLVNEQDSDFESSNNEQIFVYDKLSQSYKPMYMKMNDLNNGNNEQVFIYDKNSKQYRLINSSDLKNNGERIMVYFKLSKNYLPDLNKSQFTNSAPQNIFAYDRQSKSYKLLNVTDLNSSQSELMYVYDRNSNSYRPTMSQDKLNEQSINSPTHKMDDSPSKINKNTIMNINQIDQVEDQQYPSNIEKQVDKNKKNSRKKGLLQVKVDEREDEQIDQVQLQQNKQKQLVEQANTRLKNKKRNMKQKNKKMTNYYYQQQNQSKVDPSLLKIKKTSEEQPIILAKIRPVDNPVQLDQQKKVEKNPYLEQLIDFNQQEQNLQKSPEEEYIKQNPSTIRKRAARKKKFMQQKDNPYDYQNSSNNPAEQKQQSSKIQQRLRSQNEKNLFKK